MKPNIIQVHIKKSSLSKFLFESNVSKWDMLAKTIDACPQKF